jgi:hypothetical protein
MLHVCTTVAGSNCMAHTILTELATAGALGSEYAMRNWVVRPCGEEVGFGPSAICASKGEVIAINGATYETDEEGYLINLADWNKEIAEYIAEEEKVPLTDNHWEVINFLREYYNEYQIAPAVRVLTKAIGNGLK